MVRDRQLCTLSPMDSVHGLTLTGSLSQERSNVDLFTLASEISRRRDWLSGYQSGHALHSTECGTRDIRSSATPSVSSPRWTNHLGTSDQERVLTVDGYRDTEWSADDHCLSRSSDHTMGSLKYKLSWR